VSAAVRIVPKLLLCRPAPRQFSNSEVCYLRSSQTATGGHCAFWARRTENVMHARLFEIVQGVNRCEGTKVAVSAAVAVAAAAACVCRQGRA